MLIPVVVLAGLIFVSWFFKYRVASTTPGFECKLSEPEDVASAQERFSDWLKTGGYKPCARPQLAFPDANYRETWYAGKHGNVSHNILVSSNEETLLAAVYLEREMWFFESSDEKPAESSATDAVAHRLRSWSDNDQATQRSTNLDSPSTAESE